MIIQSVPVSSSTLYFGRDPAWLAKAWQEFVLENTEKPGITPYENILASLQARLPGTGTQINDPGLQGALARINRSHPAYPGALNAQVKHWAYTLGVLGDVDTGITADIPTFAVFCKGGTSGGADGCNGGIRTFVAYNPTGTQITVSFKNSVSLKVRRTMDVPPYTLATLVQGGQTTYDRSSTPNNTNQRLYLLKNPGFSPSCGALTGNAAMPLSPQAGTWKLPEGQTAYPTDISALDDSIVCVPARPDTGTPDKPPAAPYVRSWTGKFSGKLVQNDPKPHTRFSLYTNQSELVPGWQKYPCVRGGDTLPPDCPNAATKGGGNAVSFRVVYDFDSNGTADRIEMYQNSALLPPNSWIYPNKQTDYRFNQVYPFSPPPMDLGNKAAPFPANIPDDKPATITLIMYGGTVFGGLKNQFAVPVSVNTSPLLGRGSWIQPPYGPLEK